MKKTSTFLKTLLLLFMGGSVMTFAQVDPDAPEEAVSDSIFWEDDDIILSETVIIGKGVIDLEEDRKTPVAVSTITKQEIENWGQGNVEFPEVMKSTPSVFVANQAGGFGDSEMFLRGFDQTNTAFLLNGQPINGMEDGKVYWSNWSAMSNVANAVQIQRGLGSSKLAISSVGGTINIVTRATEKKQGGSARFVLGNDSYMKTTVAYDTGMMGKWGLSVMFDFWEAHRKYARGTQGQGQSYFVSLGYKPNDHHNFNFMIFGAPQWHNQNFSKPLKTVYWDNGNIRTPGYDITGKKGNSNYGFLNGKALNARKNYYHKPVANLNWDWDINSQASLSSVLYASAGRGGGTGPLGNGPDFLNQDMDGAILGNGDINWDMIVNDYNSTMPNGIGGGFNGTAIRSSVNNHFWYGNVTNFNYEVGENWTFNVGADVRFYQGDHFRQLVNLLGLSGWDAPNAFRSDEYIITKTFPTDPWKALTKFAKKGDRLAYDYTEWIDYQGGFGQIEYANDWFSAFVQGAGSNQSYKREDRWNNPRTTDGVTYPKKSKRVNKGGYNVKGGLAFMLNEQNTVYGNMGHYSRQPFLDNVFAGSDPTGHSDDTYLRDPSVDNEKITGIEAGYSYKTSALKVNVDLYYTKWSNRFVGLSGRNFEASDGTIYSEVAYLLTDVTQLHRGIEISFNAKVDRNWRIKGYMSIGDWEYDGSSPYEVRDQDSYTILQGESGEAHMDGLKLGNAPQFTFGMGTSLKLIRGLLWDLDFNYYGQLWGQMDIRSIDNVEQSEELSAFGTVDTGVTYEFKLFDQGFKFRGNVYNLFNSQYIARKDGFGYYYGLGRTFNLGLQYNF